MAEGHGRFEFCVDEASPGRNRGHCFVVVRSGNVNEPPLQALAGNLLGGGSRTCKSRLDRRSLGPPWRRRAPVAGGMVALVVAGAVGGLRLFAGEGGLWWIPAPTCWKGLPSIGDAASECASPSLHAINMCRIQSVWPDERLYWSACAGGAVSAWLARHCPWWAAFTAASSTVESAVRQPWTSCVVPKQSMIHEPGCFRQSRR